MDKVYVAIQYRGRRGIFKDFVQKWYREKLISSGEKTQEECDQINAYHEHIGLTEMLISPSECEENPPRRAQAKSMLTHCYGAFALGVEKGATVRS